MVSLFRWHHCSVDRFVETKSRVGYYFYLLGRDQANQSLTLLMLLKLLWWYWYWYWYCWWCTRGPSLTNVILHLSASWWVKSSQSKNIQFDIILFFCDRDSTNKGGIVVVCHDFNERTCADSNNLSSSPIDSKQIQVITPTMTTQYWVPQLVTIDVL